MNPINFILPLLIGCGTEYSVDIAGEINGQPFSPTTSVWGGPFIVFAEQDLDCMDLFWIQKGLTTGEEAPVDYDVRLLQVTYNASDVVAGNYDLTGQAPVKAEVIEISGDMMTITKASEGSLNVGAAADTGTASGDFSFFFNDSGGIGGNFVIPWCANLKSRY